MTYDVGLKKDLFRGIRLRGYASDGGIVSNEGLVSCNLWTGVLLPEHSLSTTMRERGKGARTALCFVIDLDILPPNEILYIVEVFEA